MNNMGSWKEYPASQVLARCNNVTLILHSDIHHLLELTKIFKIEVATLPKLGVREYWIYLDHDFENILIIN